MGFKLLTLICLQYFYIYDYSLNFLVLLFCSKSLFWFSFTHFGFISLLGWWSCEIINEFPSWEVWSVLLFNISVLAQQSVFFVGFIGVFIYCLLFWLLYPLYLSASSDNCFAWLHSFYFWFHFIFFSSWAISYCSSFTRLLPSGCFRT